jgi:hypothetical protein
MNCIQKPCLPTMFCRETSRWLKTSARRPDYIDLRIRINDPSLRSIHGDAIVRESHPLPLAGRWQCGTSKSFKLKDQVANYCV